MHLIVMDFSTKSLFNLMNRMNVNLLTKFIESIQLQNPNCSLKPGCYNFTELTANDLPVCIFNESASLGCSPLNREKYRKTSCISRTKSQNLNVSHLLLQWSLPNPLKPCVKLRMKM